MEKSKIAVIDDEKDICALLQEILENTGLYTVLTANNGEDGEKLCVQENPRLIFMDFVMPKVKADQLIQCLKTKAQTKNIPIILMSGLGEMIYTYAKEKWKWVPNSKVVQARGELPAALKNKGFSEDVSRTLGVQGFLKKPFTRDAVINLASELLEEGACEL